MENDGFDDLVVGVLAPNLGSSASIEDGLTCMIILHTYRFQLKEGLCQSAGWDCLTQRHTAQIMASIWAKRRRLKDTKRGTYIYWYYLYLEKTPFEAVKDISAEWKERVNRMKEQILAAGSVSGLVEG